MRHTTTGNSRPHIVHTGYRYESARHAKWEADTTPLRIPRWFWVGLILALVLVGNHAMKSDARNLCAVDGPLASECR